MKKGKRGERYDLSPVKAITNKERYGGGAKSENDYEKVKRRPTFSLTSREVPEIKDWENGEHYLVRVRMKSKSESEGDENGDGKADGQTSGTFEIVAVGPDDAAA